jgi:hypothetical protein
VVVKKAIRPVHKLFNWRHHHDVTQPRLSGYLTVPTEGAAPVHALTHGLMIQW